MSLRNQFHLLGLTSAAAAALVARFAGVLLVDTALTLLSAVMTLAAVL